LPHSQHRPLTALRPFGRCSSPFIRSWAGSECKHNSVTWVIGHTSSVYCRYVPGDEAGTKLYCLVTEAHVCEQLAQGCYLAVHRLGVERATSRLQVRHDTVTPPNLYSILYSLIFNIAIVVDIYYLSCLRCFIVLYSIQPFGCNTNKCKPMLCCYMLAPIKAQQWQIKLTWNKENVIVVDELVVS